MLSNMIFRINFCKGKKVFILVSLCIPDLKNNLKILSIYSFFVLVQYVSKVFKIQHC
jgi:hypothetical protein